MFWFVSCLCFIFLHCLLFISLFLFCFLFFFAFLHCPFSSLPFSSVFTSLPHSLSYFLSLRFLHALGSLLSIFYSLSPFALCSSDLLLPSPPLPPIPLPTLSPCSSPPFLPSLFLPSPFHSLFSFHLPLPLPSCLSLPFPSSSFFLSFSSLYKVMISLRH